MPAPGKHLLKPQQQVVVDVGVGLVRDHVNDASDTFLAFLKLERLFFAAMFVIDEQGLDELDELVDGAGRLDLTIVLHYGFADAKRDGALVLELHVVHQCRIVMHAKHLDRESVQRNSQQFHEKLHRVGVLVRDGGRFQDLTAAVKDLVHVRDVAWIRLDAKVHEGDLKLQQLAHLNVLSLLLNDLVRVLFEEAENVEVAADRADHRLVASVRVVVALGCEF